MSTVKKSAGIGKGTPGPGRPKGVPNKATAAVKEAIELVAEGLGGADRMIAWAQEDPANERAFWKDIYPKLLPLQVTGEGGKPLVPAGSAPSLELIGALSQMTPEQLRALASKPLKEA